IMRGLTDGLSDDANVIMGTRVDDSYDETIRVMAIITGVKTPCLASDGFINRTKKIVPRIKPPS
ncbi:MAG TPA: cell division protein FtsZ, partial [Euryarchaeota archaeon]|nr:cell division protein FtsZ [Euryarchaeota archaeon]